jgi:hypothetical protein
VKYSAKCGRPDEPKAVSSLTASGSYRRKVCRG